MLIQCSVIDQTEQSSSKQVEMFFFNEDLCPDIFVNKDSRLVRKITPPFCISDGKILVHSRRSDITTELSGHNQEVNCLDSKDGLIISGSRDQTARVRTPLQV